MARTEMEKLKKALFPHRAVLSRVSSAHLPFSHSPFFSFSVCAHSLHSHCPSPLFLFFVFLLFSFCPNSPWPRPLQRAPCRSRPLPPPSPSPTILIAHPSRPPTTKSDGPSTSTSSPQSLSMTTRTWTARSPMVSLHLLCAAWNAMATVDTLTDTPKHHAFPLCFSLPLSLSCSVERRHWIRQVAQDAQGQRRRV